MRTGNWGSCSPTRRATGVSTSRPMSDRPCVSGTRMARSSGRRREAILPVCAEAVHDYLMDHGITAQGGQIDRGLRDIVRTDLFAALDLPGWGVHQFVGHGSGADRAHLDVIGP